MEKKILYIASVYRHIRDFHLPHLRELNRRGYTVDLACRMPSSYTVHPESGSDPAVRDLIDLPFEKKMFSFSNVRAALQLRRRIRQESYDLVIAHTSLAAFFVRLALKGMKNRPKVINTVHGYLFDDRTGLWKRRLMERAEQFTRSETDLILTMNQWDYELAVSRRLGTRIEMIPGMGLDPGRFSSETEEGPAGCQAEKSSTEMDEDGEPSVSSEGIVKQNCGDLREQLSIPVDGFVLIFPAEFSERKSQEILIRAMRSLPEKVYLVLPGDGAKQEECRRLAAETAGERILFPGYIEDLRLWYEMADTAVSSSRYEGLPFNVLEAMYFGLPVAATSIKGHVDLLGGEPSAGLFWDYGDEAGFRECVLQLMDSPELRASLREEARRRIPQYMLDTAGPIIMEQYQSMLE